MTCITVLITYISLVLLLRPVFIYSYSRSFIVPSIIFFIFVLLFINLLYVLRKKSTLMTSPYYLYVFMCIPPIVARQRLAKRVPAATNKQATIEEMLEACRFICDPCRIKGNWAISSLPLICSYLFFYYYYYFLTPFSCFSQYSFLS
jgi:hypothetical protein